MSTLHIRIASLLISVGIATPTLDDDVCAGDSCEEMSVLQTIHRHHGSREHMGWDNYADSILGNSNGQCDKASVIGIDGTIWVSSCDTNAKLICFSDFELRTIAKGFTDNELTPDGEQDFVENGITAAGVKYPFLRAEGRTIVLGKTKDAGAITLEVTKIAILVAHTKEGGSQDDCNRAVSGIAEYLRGLGY